VVRLSLTSDDPQRDCNEWLSDGLVERAYGSRDRCLEVQEDDDPDTDSVDIGRIEIEGDEATARVTARGGDVDGVTGELELVRDGDDWRIDDLSVPLLRTLVELGLRSAEDIPTGGLDCVVQQLRALPDAEFRDFAYRLIGQRPEVQARIFELLAGCEGEGGVSLLRQAFERGIVESLREQDATQERIDCVIAAGRERVSDEQLLELLSSEDPQAAAAQALGPAVAACR